MTRKINMKRLTRVIAAVLSLVMLLGAVASAATVPPVSSGKIPIEAADSGVYMPLITVLGNKIVSGEEATGFFEIVIAVQTRFLGSAGDGSDDIINTFKSLGMVLKYDPAVLTPVGWELEAADDGSITTDIPVTDTDPWSFQLPVKKSDSITTAAALTNAEAGSPTGLLYLWAESAVPQAMYNEITEEDGTVTGYEGAQIMAVRFAIDDDYAGDITDEIDNGNILTLAGDAAAATSPAGQALWFADGVTQYYYTAVTPPEDSLGLTINTGDESADDYISNLIDEIPVKADETATFFTGGGSIADASTVFAITYMDWDGTTVLGTSVVAKTADPDEQAILVQEAMDAMAEKLQDPALEGTGNLYSADSDYPLTHKKGYSFGKWIDYNAVDADGNPYYTIYGSAVRVQNRGTIDVISAPPDMELLNMDYSNGLVVKAAYESNPDLTALDLAAAAQRDYSLTAVSYYAFATSGSSSIAFKAVRENSGNGVHRMREPAIRIAMTIGGTVVYSYYELDASDITTVEVGVHQNVTQVTAELIDLCNISSYGGTKSWATDSAARSNAVTVLAGDSSATSTANHGFVVAAVGGYINELCRQAIAVGDTPAMVSNSTSAASLHTLGSAALYTMAGFNVVAASTVAKGPGYTTQTAIAYKRRDAIANIYQAYLDLNDSSYVRDLTYDEMVYAIEFCALMP